MRFLSPKFVFLLLVFVFQSEKCAESARILGVFPFAGKSLNILYNRLMKVLADRGHDVTVISAHKNKMPIINGSFTDVVLTGFIEDYEKMLTDSKFYETPEHYAIWASTIFHDLMFTIYNKTFHHPNVQDFLRADNKFDLVITEYFWGESNFAFASIYKCPLVLFASAGGVNPWVNEMVGNPMPPSYVPHSWMLTDYSKGITFFERLHNLLYYLYDPIHNHFVSFPSHNSILKSIFPNAPDAADLYYTPSLVLLGSHSSLGQAVPLAPNMIEIGGFHIESPKKLPTDLQDFLDSAIDGAIFFSMGTHLKSTDISHEKKTLILNVFKKLKMKVLWKFEDEVLLGKPDNVLIRKWLPQVDILAHPDIKLFISHGGFGSILETIYHGVPSLMIPVFIDQFTNAKQAQTLGYGMKLSYGDKNFTEETFFSLIDEMVNNPKYKEKAKEISKLFHDRPMKPLETAMYLIEYVIRHKGANHLKVAGLKLPWYKFYMIDVLLFLVVVLIVVLYIIFRVFKKIFLRDTVSKKVKQN